VVLPTLGLVQTVFAPARCCRYTILELTGELAGVDNQGLWAVCRGAGAGGGGGQTSEGGKGRGCVRAVKCIPAGFSCGCVCYRCKLINGLNAFLCCLWRGGCLVIRPMCAGPLAT
jgi:hypothetical protein